MIDPCLEPEQRQRLLELELDWREAFAGRLADGKLAAYPAELAQRLQAIPLHTDANGIVRSPVEGLRDQPAHAAQLISEARVGERVERLARRESWWLARHEDGYIGWIRDWSLRELSDGEWTELCARRRARYRRVAGELRDERGHAVAPVFLGTPLFLTRASHTDDARTVELSLPGGTVGHLSPDELDLTLPDASASTMFAWALRCLGVAYRWGGRSASGLDCSGLVQLAACLAGFFLPRDAAQQARRGKELPLDVVAWKTGDLLFFNDPVDHVGFYDGHGGLLHARGWVRHQLLDEIPELGQQLKLARRLGRNDAIHRSTLWQIPPQDSAS